MVLPLLRVLFDIITPTRAVSVAVIL